MKSKEGIKKLSEQLGINREARGLCLAQESHSNLPHCLIGDLVDCPYRTSTLASISGENYYKCSYTPTYKRKVS